MPPSIFCRTACCLISAAGRSKTSSRTDSRLGGRVSPRCLSFEPARVAGGDERHDRRHPGCGRNVARVAKPWHRDRSRCRPTGYPRRDRRSRKPCRGTRRHLCGRGRFLRGSARPDHRHRRRQERACRAQDRRNPGLDRHPGAVCPRGRGEPRRSRHDRRRGCDPGAVEFRRDDGVCRRHRLFAALRHPADRGHLGRGLDARRGSRHGSAAAARRRGLPDGPRADNLDDGDDGAGRRARHRVARASGLFDGGFSLVSSRRQARAAPAAGRRHHACRRRLAAGLALPAGCPRRFW